MIIGRGMFQKISSGFSRRDWLLIALVILTWGANASAIKVGTNEISPYTLVFLRGLLTSLLFLPFVKKISWRDFGNLGLVSLTFFTLHYSIMYLAIDSINSNSFVVLVMLAMPFSIILSSIFLGEKIGRWTWLGLSICFAGLVVAFGIPDVAQYPLGAFLCIVTAILWAIGSLLMKRTKHIPLMTFTFYTFAMATPFLFLSAYIANGFAMFDFTAVDKIALSFSVFYQVIVMGIMASVWGYLIGNHRAEHVTPFLLLQVPVAAISGYFVLSESITIEFVLSGLLILGGVGLIHYRRLIK